MSGLSRLGRRALPFADAASEALPLGRLLRLSLFQVSVGMATVMLLGTLNRVMIVELGVAASVVAAVIAVPVLVAPFRVLLGHRSDTRRSAIGWKRVPYIWFGSIWQMGGLAVMPFALVVLSGDQTVGPDWAGEALAGAAFLMTAVGMHMTQTAGLALAADMAPDAARPRVVALLYVAFLAGMAVSALVVGGLLADFSALRLVRVVQGAGAATMLLNLVALWKQERVRPAGAGEPAPGFAAAWADYARGGQAGRLLAVVALGTAAFSMQDVLLEPYGGEVLGLSVAATTWLTAGWAAGALGGFALAARWLAAGADPHRLAARGLRLGIPAFLAVVLSQPLGSAALFVAGAVGIGVGGGLFAVATLTAAMTLPAGPEAGRGLALGAWGAAQAGAAGLAVLVGAGLRDLVGGFAAEGAFGPALAGPGTGYAAVYQLEIVLLLATLALVAPLVRAGAAGRPAGGGRLGLAQFPM